MKVQFVGYATDCIVEGGTELDRDRVSDLRAGCETFVVEDAELHALDESRTLTLPSVDVLRDDLCVVAATGPRGNSTRRLRTRPFPIRARVGPYEVSGYIHAVPTADPVSTALRRQIIPMTDGRIAFRRNGQLIERRHDGMLLNRQHIEWLEQASDEDVRLPRTLELPIAIDPAARDLTGELYT